MNELLRKATRSPVFANLLMAVLMIAGISSVISLRRETFPEFSFDRISVSVIFPGASPDDVEEGITIKIEEAVRTLNGVRKVESTSSEGVARVFVEVDADERDPRDVLTDVRNEVARLDTFPEDAEVPVIELLVNRREVMKLVLAGDLDEEALYELARDAEQDLLSLPEISEVQLGGTRERELMIAVRERALQERNLSFAQVAAAVRQRSLDLPLGKLRGQEEELLLRVRAQAERGREFEELPIVTRPDGTQVLLRDVAAVSDGFVEDEARFSLDGLPAVTVSALRTGSVDTLKAADAVRGYVENAQKYLPEGVRFEVWTDDSTMVVDRLGLMAKNGLQGLALVFVVLLVFLGPRLSFWVAVGLPVAFLAALFFLEHLGGSLNMISSFALIMVLGILVDDAIVVGENIARSLRENGYNLKAAVDGLLEVSSPVIASVTTTIVAFLPLMYIEGTMGKFMAIMPVAVIACLVASLIEALFILPSHLAHATPPRRESWSARAQEKVDGFVDDFVARRYGPSVDWALRRRYLVVAACGGFLILVLGIAFSGRPGFVFFPRIDSESVQATVTMPSGTALDVTAAAAAQLEGAVEALRQELPQADDGGPIVRRCLVEEGGGSSNVAVVRLELCRSQYRELTSLDVIARWRELAGEIPLARSLLYSGSNHGPRGSPIELRLLTEDMQGAAEATEVLREALAERAGVFNVDDNLDPGKRELRLALKPEAASLGLTLQDLAGQVAAGFTGTKLRTVQRGRDEVEVRLRYDRVLRNSLKRLDQLQVRAVDGALIPLSWVARVERGRSVNQAERLDGRRLVKITADVDDSVTKANDVVRALREDVLPALRERYPRIDFQFGGASEQQAETLGSMLTGFLLAMIGIYAILSLLFGSYIQPVIIMLLIPVGFGGAILGHVIVGIPIQIFSLFGMVGLTGIVVNDALVLIDFVNRARAEGHSPLEAARQAGRIRFRAVFLTTVTTVAGLLPLLLETSLTAQFLIPMAVSIAAGVTTATALTLYAVPCLYAVVEDVRAFYYPPQQPAEPAAPAPPAELAAD
ncbi:MAG: efflux RND transporter permease subunit [Planctomycetota bacterium]